MTQKLPSFEKKDQLGYVPSTPAPSNSQIPSGNKGYGSEEIKGFVPSTPPPTQKPPTSNK